MPACHLLLLAALTTAPSPLDVSSLKQFEIRLDKFWSNQDVMFDWTTEITGAGDRLELKLETVLESIV